MSWGTWSHAGTRCKIKTGWENEGREGIAFGFFNSLNMQEWTVVQWDGEEDPDLHKAYGLLIKRLGSDSWSNG